MVNRLFFHPVCVSSSGPMFRIRIHLIRIRIQHFRLNTDSDPIRILGFDDQKVFKKWQHKKNFLDQNLQFTYPKASINDVQATLEASSRIRILLLQVTPPLWASTAFHGFIFILHSSWVLTLMRICILILSLTSMQIRILLFDLMRIRIRIRLHNAVPDPQLNFLPMNCLSTVFTSPFRIFPSSVL